MNRSPGTEQIVNQKYSRITAESGIRAGDQIRVLRGRHRGEMHKVVRLNATEGECGISDGQGHNTCRWFRLWDGWVEKVEAPTEAVSGPQEAGNGPGDSRVPGRSH